MEEIIQFLLVPWISSHYPLSINRSPKNKLVARLGSLREAEQARQEQDQLGHERHQDQHREDRREEGKQRTEESIHGQAADGHPHEEAETEGRRDVRAGGR